MMSNVIEFSVAADRKNEAQLKVARLDMALTRSIRDLTSYRSMAGIQVILEVLSNLQKTLGDK